MGASFCTVFESETPPYGTLGSDHRVLLDTRQRLDRLAADNGLTPLGHFESYAPEDTEGLLDDEVQAGMPPAEWFAAEEGLAAVNALWDYLDAHPGTFRRQAELMEELSDLGDELEAARRAGTRFRFAVVL
jgi:hypothetical protein